MRGARLAEKVPRRKVVPCIEASQPTLICDDGFGYGKLLLCVLSKVGQEVNPNPFILAESRTFTLRKPRLAGLRARTFRAS